MVAGLLAAVIIVPFVAAAALLGPERAWAIARAAVAGTICDPMDEGPPVHRVPVITVRQEGDASSSAGTIHDGSIGIPFRRESGGTLHLEAVTDVIPVPDVALVHGAVNDMMRTHMLLWAAGRMGIPTVWAQPVWSAGAGGDGSLVWLREEPTTNYLAQRGMAGVQAGFVRFADGRATPITEAATATALDTLVSVLADSTRSLMDRHDALVGAIDVDPALRCAAVLEVIGANARPLWVWQPLRERWMPLMDAHADRSDGNDPVLKALAAEPEWRMRKAELVNEARAVLIAEGALAREFDRMVEAISPSLRGDRNKRGRVVEGDTGLYRVPLARVEEELTQLRGRLLATPENERP